MDPAVLVARDSEDVVVGNEIVRHKLLLALHPLDRRRDVLRLPLHGHADLDAGLRLDGAPLRRPLRLPGRRIPGSGVAFFLAVLVAVLRLGCATCSCRAVGKGLARAAALPVHAVRGRTIADVGKYNGGQKLFFWAMSLGAAGPAAVGPADVVPELLSHRPARSSPICSTTSRSSCSPCRSSSTSTWDRGGAGHVRLHDARDGHPSSGPACTIPRWYREVTGDDSRRT